MKRKILYFHHSIGDGGAPRSLSLLISGLQKTDFTATVVMPDRPGSDLIGNRFREAGAELIKERHIRPFHGSQVAPCNTLKDWASIRDDMEFSQVSAYLIDTIFSKVYQ